ncbi:hypothetical protein [uncultured Hyphomicrobium sp.]|uniref:hypothetical protein n=1 Tax=uncultured Hyphomicrobium sp. TaxID=194373 RepID=UPI0025D00D81|nr:hypothetical protein [uncultured Hyphomicrobium sp.]
MSLGARAFVFVVYVLLGLSFIAVPAVLISEFGLEKAIAFATFDSHLFLFFPTLGLVALAAFYLPSCAFVDMYWRYVSLGPARFLAGLILIAAGAYHIASGLSANPHRSVWDLKPTTLAADKSEPAGCGKQGGPACERVALIDGVTNLRAVSQKRLGVREFYRSCEDEPLIGHDGTKEVERFCFASTPLSEAPPLSTDAACCTAQQRYQSAIDTRYVDPVQQSITGRVHKLLLPGKVFFLFILLAISILLTVRHSGVKRHYPDQLSRIEIGVLVGAAAMIFFPLMSQGYVQSADALFGVQQKGGFRAIVPLMSFLFGAWAMLLLLFSFRQHDHDLELAAKLAGVAASTIAVFKYDILVAIVVRYLGSGASELSLLLLVGLALLAVVVLLSPLARKLVLGADIKES